MHSRWTTILGLVSYCFSNGMGVLSAKCSRHKLLLGTTVCGTLLCVALVSVVDRWTPQKSPQLEPIRVNDLPLESSSKTAASLVQVWEKEYENRVQRVRDVCERDEIAAMRRVWRVAANRRFGKEAHCKTRLCPIIIDEQKVLFFCFIPEVASTLVKRYFLNISDIALNDTVRGNKTAVHLIANDRLRRISPMYYPSTTVNRFFKIIFVKHPFDRLVSAFKSTAEPSREKVRYFYERFWDPVMKKLRPEGAPIDRITFPEFIWHLTHYPERDFDEHWSSYWNRCDPCLVDYDFIGKIETANQDFPYAFHKVGIDSNPGWWDEVELIPRSLTMKYFSTVSEEAILKLYKIYKLDFDLFGYSVDEFLSGNRTRA